MEIHKPKPWHGWREFLKEYLIIVVGVLTALGAEAVVERLHEERLSQEARTAVRDELNVDITSLARRFAPERQACLDQRLDQISALLDAAEAGQKTEAPTVIGGPGQPATYMQRWAAATAGGRTNLLASDQQRAFGRVYEAIQNLQEYEQEERKTWLVLRALRGLKHLSPEMIHDQRLAVSAARDWDMGIRSAFRTAQGYAAQVGVKGDAKLINSTAGAALPTAQLDICKPLNGAPRQSR
jgi:hypothetical protein